jgi:hypothetical protein
MTRKLNPQIDLNNGLNHVELELNVLSVARKLVEDVLYIWKRNFEGKINKLKLNQKLNSCSIDCPNSRQPLLSFKEFLELIRIIG